MIIELPNYIDLNLIEEIKKSVKPFINTNVPTEYYRDGYTVNITNNESLKELDSKLHNFFSLLHKNIIIQRYSPQKQSADSGYKYHIYNPGDIAHPHGDGELDGVFLRYASIVLCLNTPKDGGELIFPNQNRIIKTEAGKVIIFPPYGMYTHYTTPSTDPREVLVSWFIYKNIRIQENED
jgi:hypothetical protein